MLQSYMGYWDDGRVLSIGSPIKIAKNRKVIVTELDEEEQRAVKALTVKEKLAALAEIDRMLEESDEEDLRIEDFPRLNFGREPIIFSDEE